MRSRSRTRRNRIHRRRAAPQAHPHQANKDAASSRGVWIHRWRKTTVATSTALMAIETGVRQAASHGDKRCNHFRTHTTYFASIRHARLEMSGSLRHTGYILDFGPLDPDF